MVPRIAVRLEHRPPDLWDSITGSPHRSSTDQGSTPRVEARASIVWPFSPDGRFVVAGHKYGTVSFWMP